MDDRPRVMNVFVGKAEGSTIRGRWVDLPDGERRGSGSLALRIEPDGSLSKIEQDPPMYLGSRWVRKGGGGGDGGPTGNFAGQWTSDDGYQQVPMTLQQDGNRVTGTYEHRGGRIEGTVTGSTLTFTWRQDDRSGTGSFTLGPDGTTFEGTWTAETGEPREGTWRGWRGSGPPPPPPAEGSFSGFWEDNTGARMVLTQEDDRVLGTYNSAGGLGLIEGRAGGGVLRLKWSHDYDAATGAAKLTLNADGNSFTGTFSNTNDPDAADGGTWNGRKTGPLHDCFFGGIWRTTDPPRTNIRMELRDQAGGRVIGEYDATGGQGRIEGQIAGYVLRLKWWHDYDPIKGSARFLMGPGNSAFAGTWNYADDPDGPPDGTWTGRVVPIR
jgi:hypothetical protein